MRPTYLTINTSLVRENLRKIKDSLPEWSTSTAVIQGYWLRPRQRYDGSYCRGRKVTNP